MSLSLREAILAGATGYSSAMPSQLSSLGVLMGSALATKALGLVALRLLDWGFSSRCSEQTSGFLRSVSLPFLWPSLLRGSQYNRGRPVELRFYFLA